MKGTWWFIGMHGDLLEYNSWEFSCKTAHRRLPLKIFICHSHDRKKNLEDDLISISMWYAAIGKYKYDIKKKLAYLIKSLEVH